MKTKVTDQDRTLSSPGGEVWAEFFLKVGIKVILSVNLDIRLSVCSSCRHHLFYHSADNPIKSASESLE